VFATITVPFYSVTLMTYLYIDRDHRKGVWAGGKKRSRAGYIAQDGAYYKVTIVPY
jgi:hypothetical protein